MTLLTLVGAFFIRSGLLAGVRNVGMVAAASTSTWTAINPPSPEQAEYIRAAFIAGLIGDSLALGGHYEYDAHKIAQQIGSYRDFKAPGEGLGGQTHGVGWGAANYHPGKIAGK